MAILYRDHLTSSCNEEILSIQAVTDPRNIGTPIDLTFNYKLGYDLNQLNTQAQAFMIEFRSRPNFVSALDKCISLPFQERDNAVMNVYKYSLYKSFGIINQLVENGYNYLGNIPANSYLFYGHKELVYTFMNYNTHVQSCSQNMNLYVSRILTIPENFLDDMENDPFFLEIQNEVYPGGIYNPTYERILHTLSTIDGIECEIVSDMTTIDMSGFKIPLGNMVYQDKPGLFTNNETIGTVRTLESLTDHISKYWNIANFIYCTSIPDYFSNSSTSQPYSYVESSRLSPFSIFAQIESITGIDCNGKYSTYGVTYPYSNVPHDPRGPFNPGGSTPVSPAPTTSPPSSPQTPRKAPRNNKPKGPNVMKTVGKQLAQHSKSLGRALSSTEAKSLINSLGNAFIDYKFKEAQINTLINNARNNKVIIDNTELSTNLGIVGSNTNNQQLYLEGK